MYLSTLSCTVLNNLSAPFSFHNCLPSYRTAFSTTRAHFFTRNPYSFPFHFDNFGFRRRELLSTSGMPELSKRCRLTPLASSLELPLLPFTLNEVLVPSESKTLHLYEARYLALLNESLERKKQLFVHFVLDPIIVDEPSAEPSFAARYGCLVSIENVERLDVGALVSIRGVGRVQIVQFLQADPYLNGVVVPEQDKVCESPSRLSLKVTELKEALYSLNSLEIKLKAPNEAKLQTNTTNSLVWAEKEPSIDCDEAFVPSSPERVSFAAFQSVSGSSQSELVELQRKKLRAMDLKDTLERLDSSLQLIKETISLVAAKLALQSLEIK